MTEFPNITREQSLVAKLTDKDIADIQARYASGEHPRKIADDYPFVRPHSLYYWFKTPEQRKELNRQSYLTRKLTGTLKSPQEYDPDVYKKYRARKLELTNQAEYEKDKSRQERMSLEYKQREKLRTARRKQARHQAKSEPNICKQCGSQIPIINQRKDKTYCGVNCKQNAYRQRKKEQS